MAAKILAKPAIREAVETLDISGAEPYVIKMHLEKVFNFNVTEKAIESYLHSYFNKDLVSRIELIELMQLRLTSVEEDEQVTSDIVKYSMSSDPRLAAAKLPRGKFYALLTLVNMGHVPTSIDVGELFKSVRNMALIRALEVVSKGDTRGSSNKFMQYVTGIRQLQEIIEGSVSPEKELINQLTQLRLQRESSDLVLTADLEGEIGSAK